MTEGLIEHGTLEDPALEAHLTGVERQPVTVTALANGDRSTTRRPTTGRPPATPAAGEGGAG